MPSPTDIKDSELRAHLTEAFAAMRAGKGADAVRTIATAYLTFIESHPDYAAATLPMGGREIPRFMRWPTAGAELKRSEADNSLSLTFSRERFSVSEAMTCYQFLLDEAVTWERQAPQ